MFAHSEHTGCWIYLSLLLIITIEQIKCQDPCSSSGTAPIAINSLTMDNPLVEEMIKHFRVRVTQNQLEDFLSGKEEVSDFIDCPSLEKFFESLPRITEVTEPPVRKPFDVKPKVWIASIVAVVIISAAGLLGVAIVPLFKKAWYDDVIQYLVALAVGCLTGDAFLHLLPHAIAGEHAHGGTDGLPGDVPEEDNEREATLKGLVALCGIYFFFIAEKIVTSISNHRIERNAEEEETLSKTSVSKSDNGMESLDKLSESGTLRSDHRLRRSLRRPKIRDFRPASPAASVISDDMLITGLASKAMKTAELLTNISEETESIQVKDTANSNQRSDQRNSRSKKNSDRLDVTKIELHGDECLDCAKEEGSEKDDISINPIKHDHGHSHKFCTMNWKNLPSSMASVAWMVIMGDGLHNFTDGMAIGVAFASSISGGISTSIAVFCHELPHELGDFAVLLKTGMGIKEAMFFNIFSSVLCVVGMIIGIGVGNIESASSWIFALTAGTFVYIALVDMLPELSSFRVREGQSRIVQIVIQNAGLLSGAGIMLIIALFEKEMQNMISS